MIFRKAVKDDFANIKSLYWDWKKVSVVVLYTLC